MNVVSFGGGTNSTAMIIGMYLHKIPVDLILFADTGGEQPHTYEFIRVFNAWLDKHGLPKVIAQWLCLTERRVRQLRDEGVIVEARPGLYELQPTVARYIKYLGGAGKESLNTERMKLTAEKRKAAEMDNDLRRGDLHSTQDIEKGIQTMCLNIRSRFLAMPAKLSPTLAAMDGNQAAIFDEMKKAIDETLEELSDYRVAFAVEDTADERTEEK